MALKVIGAGFGRTGTNSFKEAMGILGLGPCHHMFDIMQGEAPLEAWKKAAAGTLTDWEELYEGWVSVCDFPHCVFYEELAAFYPEAKVVLTTRDPESWYESARSTIFSPESVDRIKGAIRAGENAPEQFAVFPYVFGVIERVIDADISDKDKAIASLLAHEEKVKQTVPPERLLVYEAKQGWEPLCEFLEVPVPELPYPRTNSTEEFQGRRAAEREASE